ncbi:MAG: glycosyltransferase [Hyphomonadaceae bacterium]
MAEGAQHSLKRSSSAVERQAVLVLGMHRSGTSVLTQLLSLAGLRLPAHLLGGQKGNEQGHWEPKSILDLHERMLEEAGSQWYDWRQFHFSQLNDERQRFYRDEIKRLISQEFVDGAAFVLKEPRICRFAELYISLLRDLRIKPAFVLPYRNPLAVMRSLGARDGHTPAFASLLWLRHVLDAEASTRGFPRAIVAYETLLVDWRLALHLIASRTGAISAEVVDPGEVELVLSTRLQHHAPSRMELERDDGISEWVKRVFAAYRALEQDPNDEVALGALDEVKSAFDGAAATFGPAMFQELDARETAHVRAFAAAHDEFERRLQETRAKDAQVAEADRQQASAFQGRIIITLAERNIEYAVRATAREFEFGAVDQELRLTKAQLNTARSEVEVAQDRAATTVELERTRAIVAEGRASAAAEQARVAEERANSATEEARAAEERANSATEEARAAEERANSATEEARAAEERANSATEQARAAEERANSATEQARAAEERANSATERARAAEEHARVADEWARAVNDTLTVLESERTLIQTELERQNVRLDAATAALAQREVMLAQLDEEFRGALEVITEQSALIEGSRVLLEERDALLGDKDQRLKLLAHVEGDLEEALIENAALKGVDLTPPSFRPDELDLSIVVPCYNQGQFVADELALLAQEPGLSLEIIVVNDGSTEARTARALDALRGHPRLKIITQDNGGLSAARNTGLLAARGKFVLFLDADDVLAPGLTERVKQAEASGTDVTIFDYLVANEYLTYFERPTPYTISADLLNTEAFEYHWERGLTVPIHSAIFRRQNIRALFHTGMAAKEDWVFWVTNFRAGMTASYVPVLQAIYRISGSNMTKNVGRMMESWISAARFLGDRLDTDRTRFVEASMAHVRSYYIPVLQWHGRHSAESRSRLERLAHRIWLYLETVGPKGVPQRVAKGAVRHSLRWARRTVSNQLEGLRALKHTPPHVVRRANFALRRGTPKHDVAFSVVVPVYNHAQHLSRCFTSLTDQKHRPFEIIAIDDCSPDPRVREIMDIYERGNPGVFRAIYNERNLGISTTLNRGIEAARGEWIVMVDCDDWLELDALNDVSRAIHGREGIGYVFTDRRRIDEVTGKDRVEQFGGRLDLLSKPFADALRMSMVASHLKVIRRDVHFDVGGYDPTLDGVQDWDFALRAMNRGVQFSYVPKPVYNYRWHPASVSLSAAMTQWRLANVVRQKSMFDSRPPPPSLEQIRSILARHKCAVLRAGQAHAFEPMETPPEDAHALLLRIENMEQVRWIERLRCAGFNTCVVAVIDAPYVAEFAGEFRQVSGFFDQILTADPMWTIALSPVAPHDKHVVFEREYS